MTNIFTPHTSDFLPMDAEEQDRIDRYIKRGCWLPFASNKTFVIGSILGKCEWTEDTPRLTKTHKWRIIGISSLREYLFPPFPPRVNSVIPPVRLRYFYRIEAAD